MKKGFVVLEEEGGYSVSILALNEDRMQNYPYPNFRNNLLRMCVKLLIFS